MNTSQYAQQVSLQHQHSGMSSATHQAAAQQLAASGLQTQISFTHTGQHFNSGAHT